MLEIPTSLKTFPRIWGEVGGWVGGVASTHPLHTFTSFLLICVAWEVLQALRFRVWKEKHHKGSLWAWNPSVGFCTHRCLGQNHEGFVTCDG